MVLLVWFDLLQPFRIRTITLEMRKLRHFSKDRYVLSNRKSGKLHLKV